MKNLLNLSQKQATEICELRKHFDNTPTELLVADLGKIVATYYYHFYGKGMVKEVSRKSGIGVGCLHRCTMVCGQHVRPAFETYYRLIALGPNPDVATPVEVESVIGLSQKKAKDIVRLHEKFNEIPGLDINLELLSIMKTYRTRTSGFMDWLCDKTGLSASQLYKLSKPSNVNDVKPSFDTYVRIIALGPNKSISVVLRINNKKEISVDDATFDKLTQLCSENNITMSELLTQFVSRQE